MADTRHPGDMNELSDWCLYGNCPAFNWQAFVVIGVVFVLAGWTLWHMIKLRHH
jgi:hypothetical protein